MSDENKPQGNSDWLKTYSLNLVDRVSCDGIRCDKDATHYIKLSCCGGVIIVCEDCTEKVFQTVLGAIEQRTRVFCSSCGRPQRPQGWLSKPNPITLT